MGWMRPVSYTHLKMQELSDTEDDSQKTSIQKEIDTLNEELEKLNDNYSTLQLNVDEAKRKQTTESITARQKYEEAMLNYKNAANLYAIDTNGLDDTLQDLQDVYKRQAQPCDADRCDGSDAPGAVCMYRPDLISAVPADRTFYGEKDLPADRRD